MAMKIKVFLSSYGNMAQAQCLNCRALAKTFDWSVRVKDWDCSWIRKFTYM